MEYESTWTNCDESSASIAWRNTQQYPPSYFPGAYDSYSSSLSYPDESLSYVNYRPAPYVNNYVNGNSRYAFHPYHTCVGQTKNKGATYFQPFHNVSAYSSDIQGNRCCESVDYQHPHMRNHLCKPRPNMKYNPTKQCLKRKKKKTNEAKNQNKKISSVVGHNVATNNFTQESFEQMTNIPQSVAEDKYVSDFETLQLLRECNQDSAILEYPGNSCAFQQKEIVNLPSSLNDPSFSMANVNGSNTESMTNPYDQDQNVITCTSENINCDAFNTSEDVMATDVNSLQPGKLQMGEDHNKNSEECIMHSEELEQSEYTLQTVIEGVDEDGNNIVLLLATPEIENTVQLSLINSEFMTQTTRAEGNTDFTGNTAETVTLSKEDCSEDYLKEVNQGTGSAKIDVNEVFLSCMDDFASEEVVETTKPNTKKKQRIGLNGERFNANKQKSTKQLKKTSDCASGTTDTNNEQVATNRKTQVPRVKSKRRNNVNANTLKWKSHFQWKSKDNSFKDLQNVYFRQFMRNFRAKNTELDNDDVLLKMLRVILHKVGGSVMESVYKTFHELIAIYTTDMDITEKGSKRSKPMKVKFSKQKK